MKDTQKKKKDGEEVGLLIPSNAHGDRANGADHKTPSEGHRKTSTRIYTQRTDGGAQQAAPLLGMSTASLPHT